MSRKQEYFQQLFKLLEKVAEGKKPDQLEEELIELNQEYCNEGFNLMPSSTLYDWDEEADYDRSFEESSACY